MSTGLKARCNALSSRLVSVWNRRTAVEIELQRHHLEAPRRTALTLRLHALHGEQDQLEVQMTEASQALMAQAEDRVA